jgi:hypothetical protein
MRLPKMLLAIGLLWAGSAGADSPPGEKTKSCDQACKAPQTCQCTYGGHGKDAGKPCTGDSAARGPCACHCK